MKKLLLLCALLVQNLLTSHAAPGDAVDNIKNAAIPEGVRWVEIGFFVVTPENWTTVEVTYTNFVDPVVFLSMPQLAGDTTDQGVAQALRVNNTRLDRIDADTSFYYFDAKIYDVNTSFCSTKWYTPKDINVNSTFIGWIVVEKGKFTVTDKSFVIGTETLNRTTDKVRDSVNHFRSFVPQGVCDGVGADCSLTGVDDLDVLVLGQLQTTRFDKYLLLRGITADSESVTFALQPHDSVDYAGYVIPWPGEDIAWMMFELGIDANCVEDLAIESSRRTFNWNRQVINYDNLFLIPPALFGMIRSTGGVDSVSLRMFNLGVSSAEFITQEDKCAKEETRHEFLEITGVLVIGRTAAAGTTVCGATFNDNQPTMNPTAAPTPAPSARPTTTPSAVPSAKPTLSPTRPILNDSYCVEVTLYDTFGDGWGDNVALQVWGPEYETEYIYYDCPNDFPRVLCYPPDSDVYFDIVTFEPPAVETWEMYWTVKTLGQLGNPLDEYGEPFVSEFYLGDFDTNMTAFNTQVDVFNPVDTTNQTCSRCKHPPKPKAKPKASPRSSSSSKSSSSESSSGPSGKSSPGLRVLHSSSNESFASYSNSSYYEEDSSSGKPKPKHWPFPVTIFDEDGTGWFNGSEAWVMVPEYNCDGSVTYSDNRRLPEVLTNPEYVISTVDRVRDLRRQTICGDLLKETCEERLPDGDYIFRVGGALSRDHTVNNSAWDFCGVRGRSMEELEFSMEKGKCVAGNKLSASNLCCSDVTARAAIYDGTLVLSNVAGAGITEYDTNLLESVLAESFSTVHGGLHGSVALTSWEFEGSVLTVQFRLAFDPTVIGVSINHYQVLDALSADLMTSTEAYITAGTFLSTMQTALANLPLGKTDVLLATSGVTLINLQYIDSTLKEVQPSLSGAYLAKLESENSLSSELAPQSHTMVTSAEHSAIVVVVSVIGTAFVLAVFGIMSRSSRRPAEADHTESEDALMAGDCGRDFSRDMMALEREPEI